MADQPGTTNKAWREAEAKRLAWTQEQARRVRNNKIEAMLEAHNLDAYDFIEWVKERLRDG